MDQNKCTTCATSRSKTEACLECGRLPLASVTGDDLIGWGWPSGPQLGMALAKAKELAAADKSLEEIRDKLESIKPAPVVYLQRRKEKLNYELAIQPENEIEQENVAKVQETMDELMRTPVLTQGAIMPDACPAGPMGSIPVGGAVISEAIHPSFHSADICCSMWVTLFDDEFEGRATNDVFLDKLQSVTRFGPGGRPVDEWISDSITDSLEDTTNLFLKDLTTFGKKHLADQGDGNHFAYLGRWKIEDGTENKLRKEGYGEIADSLTGRTHVKALVTHHGSRGLGAQVYKRGMKTATKMTDQIAKGISKSQCWIPADSDEGDQYWQALQYVADWTRRNHELIHQLTAESLGISQLANFGNEHNFVWKRDGLFYHGKGATPAWLNDDGSRRIGVIPLNMSEPILLVLGSDNEKYCSFAPHGAGRNFSRSALMRSLELDDASEDVKQKRIKELLDEQTDGLDVRFYCGLPDLSETPMAYKNADAVRQQIEQFQLADVFGLIEPIGCIMAGDFPDHLKPAWQRKRKS